MGGGAMAARGGKSDRLDTKGSSQRLGYVVLGISLTCLVLAWFIILWNGLEERGRQEQELADESSRMTQVASEQARHIMSVSHLFMRLAAEWIGQHPAADPRYSPEFAQMVETFRQNLKGNAEVRLIDYHGDISYISGLDGVPGIRTISRSWVGDRDFFQAQQSPGARGFFVGAPWLNKAAGRMLLPLSYPIERNGRDQSMLLVTIDMPAFYSPFEAARPQPDGKIELYRNDGMLLVSLPPSPQIGVFMSKGSAWRQHYASSMRGSARIESADRSHIAAWWRSLDYPLTVVVTRDPLAGYAEWIRFMAIRVVLLLLITGVVAVLLLHLFRVIAIQERYRARLEQIARFDDLTGLLNRAYFLLRAEDELARADRYGRPLCLALLDLDHFKSINDRHGHAAGDEALRGFARVALAALRGSDLIGRVGGEEFVAVMPETSLGPAREIAERLRGAVNTVATGNGPLGASVGLAQWRGPAESLTQLMQRADAAMYAAKAGGRNRVVVAADDGEALAAAEFSGGSI